MDFAAKLERAISLTEDENSRAMAKAALSNMLDQAGLLVAADAVEEMGDAASTHIAGLIRQAVAGETNERFTREIQRVGHTVFNELEKLADCTAFRRHHGYNFWLNKLNTTIGLAVTPQRIWGTMNNRGLEGEQRREESGDIDQILEWFPATIRDHVLIVVLLASLFDATHGSSLGDEDNINTKDYASRRIGSYASEVYNLANTVFMREEDGADREVETSINEISVILDDMEEALEGLEPRVVGAVVDRLDTILQRLTSTYNNTPAMTRVFSLISASLGRMSRGR